MPGKNLTQEQFLILAKSIHGDSFDYTNTIYNGRRNDITIKCNSCQQIYETSCHRHLSGFRCRIKECRYKSRTLEQFIEESTKIHDGKFSYENIVIFSRVDKLPIICPIHGEFLQTAGGHLSGKGCLECKNDNQKWTTEIFIKKATETHGDRYDYSKSIYQSSQEKITIICKKHGEFYPAPVDHVTGKTGCRTCGLESRFGHIFEIGEKHREYRTYYKRVRYLTSVEYKKYKDIVNPENLPRGNLKYHIDHMYSVKNGFLNNIQPEIISSYVNLTMLSHSENSSKSLKNSQAIEELNEKYKNRKIK